MNSSFTTRVRVLSIFILFFALIMIGKLFLVQIVHSEQYSSRADRQYVTPSGDIFERRTIFFERKDGQLVSAASQVSGYKVAINPKEIKDAEFVYNKLTEFIELDRESFFAKASKTEDPYEEVAFHLFKEDADKISKEKIPGVYIYREKWRFYPGGNLASHTLGLVGFNEDKLEGRYGLERQYNGVLSRDQDDPYVNFFAEVFSNVSRTLFKNEDREGDLVTTIEPAVQGTLEKKMSEVKAKYNTESVGGIIMNPIDGSIYALSALPDFDPNNFAKTKNVDVFTNPLVENVFEFGSVVKTLAMAAGLDAGVINPDTKYDDHGFVVVEGKKIYNFDKKARGNGVTMQEVIGKSLNTGMVFIYERLGKEKFRDYMLGYGMKEETGIDLPSETSGLVANLNSPRDIEYANASFGQGIALTPVGMIRALASLSNGGNLVTPHVVKSIKYDDGTEKVIEHPIIRSKISEDTSTEITAMLVQVMDKFFQNGNASMEHYSIALKTGTAQVAKESGGGYYEDKYLHSFFGYFPAYDPKFIVFLYAVDPKGVPFASETWGNTFVDIAKFLLNYYEVPPDR